MANGKDLRKLLKTCEEQGFSATKTARGHWIVRDTDGRAVTTMAGSPSDHRSWLNSLSHLKRAGLVWPPPSR